MREQIAIPSASSGWDVSWDDLQSFPWVQSQRGCLQDPVQHGEGDAWIHTRMVLHELVADPAWRAADEGDREIAYLAALLHDVGKPSTTQVAPDGRVTAPGHARRGAIGARAILWRMGYPFAVREAVCALVRHHQAPYYLIDADDALARLARISQSARCDLLYLIARADIRGRVCSERERLEQNVELFALLAKERDCWRSPLAFSSAHARFLYFRGRDDASAGQVFDDTRFEVILMCGLPGVGKDTWIREHAPHPVVSLDAIRSRMGIDPSANQGPVRQAALARARDHLRRGEPFVWNATNLLAQRRAQLIDLFHHYKARIRIVYVEVPHARQRRQNRSREQAVPERALRGMMSMWEVPDLTEAQRVDYIVDDTPPRYARRGGQSNDQ